MIQKLFLLAISFVTLVAKSCHDNFTPDSFEEAEDSLVEFIDETFYEQNLTFFPKKGSKSIKLKSLKGGLKEVEVVVDELRRLSESEAFNTYNDLLGGIFYDYEIDSYKMEFIPYEARVYYKGVYFGVMVELLGVKGDSSNLKSTRAKITLIDYSKWVRENIRCKESR